MFGRLKNPVEKICAFCGKPYQTWYGIQKYCSMQCQRKIGERPEKFCEVCKISIGMNRHRRWCKECAPKMYNHPRTPEERERYLDSKKFREQAREYQYLLAHSEGITRRGFIRLMCLADMMGRDLEEWINQSEHMKFLSESYREEQRLFDEGKKKESDPDYLADVQKEEERKKKNRDYMREYYRKRREQNKQRLNPA